MKILQSEQLNQQQILKKKNKIYIVLVDDCSNDSTLKIAKHAKENNQIDLIHSNKKNLGVSNCRNIGINLCRSTDYITFLDADDCLYSDLSKIIEKKTYMLIQQLLILIIFIKMTLVKINFIMKKEHQKLQTLKNIFIIIWRNQIKIYYLQHVGVNYIKQNYQYQIRVSISISNYIFVKIQTLFLDS